MVENQMLISGDMSLEDALKELEIIVRRMEEGRMPLAESIQACERGAALMNHANQLIEQTRTKVEEILKLKDGTIEVKASDIQDNI